MNPALIMAALGLLSTGAQYVAGQKQTDYQKGLENEQRRANRAAAIERAMGGTSISRYQENPRAPDTSNYALVSGLSNLGSNLVAKNYL